MGTRYISIVVSVLLIHQYIHKNTYIHTYIFSNRGMANIGGSVVLKLPEADLSMPSKNEIQIIK